MSKSTSKGIKKTAGFWDTVYRYTLKPIVDAGEALGKNAYKFTPGAKIDLKLLRDGAKATYTPALKDWLLGQQANPTLTAVEDYFYNAPNNAALHIASNYTAPFLRDISGYNAIESAIKEHRLQNKLHSNQDQSIKLVNRIGDLRRAPLGAPPESLLRLHEEYSDKLEQLRGLRRKIQGDLNYQGAKTDASVNNILMFSPMQKVLGWADLDHLVPQDTSHPAYLEYLQGLGLTPLQYERLKAINDRRWATDIADTVLMSYVGGGASLKLMSKGAPAAIKILTNHLISRGMPAAAARRYATATVLMGAGYIGQLISLSNTNHLAYLQRKYGHTPRGYMALSHLFPNTVPFANTVAFTNVADAAQQHLSDTARAYYWLSRNGKTLLRPVVSIPYVRPSIAKKMVVGAGAGLFMPGTPLPNWALRADNIANMLQLGVPLADPTTSRILRTADLSTLPAILSGSSYTALAPLFNLWKATRYALNPADITTPDIPMIRQNIAGLPRRSDIALDFATVLFQTEMAGVRWPSMDGAKKLLKSTNPKDVLLSRRQLDSALTGLMRVKSPLYANTMGYIQLKGEHPGAARMLNYYQQQLTSYIQSASPQQLADVLESRIPLDMRPKASTSDLGIMPTSRSAELLLDSAVPDLPSDIQRDVLEIVNTMRNQGIITKLTTDQLLDILRNRKLIAENYQFYDEQDYYQKAYPEHLQIPGVRLELIGL